MDGKYCFNTEFVRKVFIFKRFNMKKKVGLLGGTFDPIHNGHLNLAFELMEKRDLSEVWFIPACLNPLKNSSALASFDQRSKMIELALANIPFFFLNRVEERLPSPSYTINMLRALINENNFQGSPCEFYLLTGEDSLETLHKWVKVDEILNLVPLLIGSRFQSQVFDLQNHASVIKQAANAGWTQINLMDISSHGVRDRLFKNLCVDYLVPGLVLRYIQENQLYSPLSSTVD